MGNARVHSSRTHKLITIWVVEWGKDAISYKTINPLTDSRHQVRVACSIQPAILVLIAGCRSGQEALQSPPKIRVEYEKSGADMKLICGVLHKVVTPGKQQTCLQQRRAHRTLMPPAIGISSSSGFRAMRRVPRAIRLDTPTCSNSQHSSLACIAPLMIQ